MLSKSISLFFFNALKDNKPFAIYCKPNSNILNGLFQKSEDLMLLDSEFQSGFVIAPFDSNENTYLIPLDKSDFLQEKLFFEDVPGSIYVDKSYNRDQKVAFENLVAKIVSEINSTNVSKIVASRIEELNIENLDVLKVFKLMLSKYQTAFRYCFYLPNVGFWIGATPEKLVSIESNVLETMAYAGTQVFDGDLNPIWGDKEKDEQQFVTDFIVSNLETESEKIQCSDPYTSKAGTLLHIRTDIKANLKSGYSLKRIVNKLHPTPAVCGMPKELAKNFILNNEGYDRKFYSGYLGEINFGNQNKTEFYVNLRCMEILKNKVLFYIGCGITKDSDPELEFFETVNKSITMKSLFV